MNLGYPRVAAEKTLAAAVKNGKSISFDLLFREALGEHASKPAGLVPDESEVEVPIVLAGFRHFFHFLPGVALRLRP